MCRVVYCLLTLLLVVTSHSGATAEDDSIPLKLAAAKSKYDDAAEKARDSILDGLKKKAATAKNAGDLETLEAIQTETKAFEDAGVLPRSVPIKQYESQMKLARARLEESYNDAIKQYTKEGKIELAKAVRQEREEFLKPTAFKQFEGDWTVKFRNGITHTYAIDAQGTVKCVHEVSLEAKLYRKNDDVLLDLGRNKIERHSIVRGKLVVEHWVQSEDYSAGKPPSNVGASVEKR